MGQLAKVAAGLCKFTKIDSLTEEYSSLKRLPMSIAICLRTSITAQKPARYMEKSIDADYQLQKTIPRVHCGALILIPTQELLLNSLCLAVSNEVNTAWSGCGPLPSAKGETTGP
ncbi:hypothetical protein TNIN_81661 [Trichonephila inaurata madagascariensis]|uniref:Uncharacterized protein n=1 Tax=Trichonephila inaurata madagascariensis TaxID=2747483 RepID=A0A8X6Y146_9ARAC|nr:hypothetical protein TNIN_81661 [Trichonephila inaurata madagascariensis]